MGDEGWYAIQSIHGRVVMLDLDAGTSAPTSSYGGYCGETEAVTTYKRETIKTALVNSQYTTIQEIQDSGTAGNIIQFQGGWTINGNQDGETFFDGLMGYGYGLYASSKNYITINNIAVFRYYIGVYFSSGQDITFNMISNVNNCSYYGFSVASITRLTITTLANCNNIAGYGNSITISSITTLTVTDIINSHSNYYGPTISSIGGSITNIKNICGHYSTSFTLGITSGTVGTISNMKWNGGTLSVANANNMTISEITNVTYNVGYVGITGNSCVIAQITNITNNASTYGLYFTGSMNTIQNVTACSGSTYGVCFNGGFNAIYGGTIGGVTCAVYSTSSVANYLNHVVLNGTEFSAAGAGYTYSNNHDNQSGASYISTQYGTITSDTTANRHTASGICWKFSPTSSSATISNPLRMIIAWIACAANSPVTFSAYVKKSSAGDIGCKLVIYPYQLNGVTLTTVTKDDNTNYDNLTLPTFTPSESGVIEVEAQVYWVANTADESVYIDDISVSQ
jgi:hypothetical protein